MFIIKWHYEATENNPNFPGEIKDYYMGKAGEILSCNKLPAKGEIEEYGYKTMGQAKRGLAKAQEAAKWENERGFWKVSVSLVNC